MKHIRRCKATTMCVERNRHKYSSQDPNWNIYL